MKEERISDLLGQEITTEQAIQVARIVSYAPEERLPMILDIFSMAGIEISGMETIEALKEAARKRAQIEDLEGFLDGLTKLSPEVSGEHRILTEVFNNYCKKHGQKERTARRALAEMDLIRVSPVGGKQEFTVTVYSPGTKRTERCVCVFADWRQRIGLGRSENR